MSAPGDRMIRAMLTKLRAGIRAQGGIHALRQRMVGTKALAALSVPRDLGGGPPARTPVSRRQPVPVAPRSDQRNRPGPSASGALLWRMKRVSACELS